MNQDNKGKSIYLLYGVLCLIPVIGLITGLLAISKGVQKDKRLVIIGIIGILITILAYSFHFYQAKYGHKLDNSYVLATEVSLNKIANGLEGYKSINKSYPDSLEQLWEIDPTLNFSDIMINRTSAKKDNYRYIKHKNKYELFSVGLDGKPNTKDDIYPYTINLD